MAQTHKLSDGGHLCVSVVSDAVEKKRRTAQTWSFRWCQVQLSMENLSKHVIPTVSTSVPISASENSTRKEHRLTVWIPHCYLPKGLPVVRQQLELEQLQVKAGGNSGLLPLSGRGSSHQNPIILDLESDSD